MASNKIYSFADNSGYMPGAFLPLTYAINENNRQLRIKSIFIEIGIVAAVGGNVVPWQMNTAIQYILSIGPGFGNPPISSCFEFTGLVPSFNGNGIVISNPGLYKFENFYFTNTIPFSSTIRNTSAATNYQVNYSFAVEIEENIIYQ